MKFVMKSGAANKFADKIWLVIHLLLGQIKICVIQITARYMGNGKLIIIFFYFFSQTAYTLKNKKILQKNMIIMSFESTNVFLALLHSARPKWYTIFEKIEQNGEKS